MKVIKTLFILGLLLVVVVVGGVAAFIGFADPNDFKEQIAAKVREDTGRELRLDGPLEWGFWPKIHLRAGPLSLGNAAGFGDEPMFAADEIQIAVATLPLLSSRLEMDTVILHGINVNLARNEDGVSNWDDLASGDAQEERGGDGLASIVLGGVDIKDSRFSYRDDTTGQHFTISNLTATTGALTFGDPVDFALSLTAVANEPALDSDLKLTGTVSYNLDDEHYVISPLALNALLRGKQLPGGKANVDFGAVIDINLDEETATISDLRLDGLGTNVTGQFSATDIEDDKPSAKGALKITGKDLAAVFNAFQLPVGKQLGTISDRSFNFETAFDANMDSGDVVVEKLDGNMLGATLGGSFTATNADTDKPDATGKLRASGPDLPTLLAVLGQLQGADEETLKSLNQALAGAKDKSFSVSADLDAKLSNGTASLPVLEAKLLGNTITGNISATNAASDKPAVTGTLNASGPDFPTLLTVIAQMQGADADTLKGLNAGLKGAADKSFSVKADIDADLAKGTAALPKLDAKLLGNSITGKLQASRIDSDKPAATGVLNASGSDLPALLAIASQFQEDGKGLRDMAKALAKEKNKAFQLEVDFGADMDSGQIDVNKLSADLLGLEVRGGLKGKNVDFEKGKGSLDGEISVVSQDLGTLLRSRDQADLAKSLKTLDLKAGIKGSLSDLSVAPLSLTTMVSSPEVKKPVELKLTAGEARANLDKDTLELKNVTVTGLGLNAKADISAEKISTEPAFSGRLDVPAFNLRTLLASLNKPVPKTADPKALTRVGLAADFNGTSSSIRLKDLRIGLDDTKLQGDINVLNFAGPHLEFGLGIDGINADRYLEPSAPGKAKAVTPEAAAAGAASELPVETLRALRIKGDLLIGSLVLSGAKMKDIKFSINADKGIIKLAPIGAQLYEGSYGGDIVLNAQGKTTTLQLKTALNKVNVEPLIIDTVQNNMLSGIVSFDAALTGTGGDADRIKKTITGNGKFSTVNGVFRGVDAVAVLKAVEQIIECRCPVPIPKDGETRFNSLGGTLLAKNGIIRNDDLLLSGDGFVITGRGTLANLQDNTVKYDLKLSVAELARKGTNDSRYNLGGYDVPITCRGNIESPRCVPDAGDILKQVVANAAKKKIEEAVGDKLKDAIGGEAGDALKKLFKF